MPSTVYYVFFKHNNSACVRNQFLTQAGAEQFIQDNQEDWIYYVLSSRSQLGDGQYNTMTIRSWNKEKG